MGFFSTTAAALSKKGLPKWHMTNRVLLWSAATSSRVRGWAYFRWARGKAVRHVDGHRLVVPGGQLIHRLIHRVGQPQPVIAGVQLHPAARPPPEVLLHPLCQVGDGSLPPAHEGAVQPDAVVEQVGRVAVIGGVQTTVAHHHPVDHPQLPIDLPQVGCGIFVPHLLRHGVGVGRGGKEVKVGVDNPHGPALTATAGAACRCPRSSSAAPPGRVPPSQFGSRPRPRAGGPESSR